MSTGRPGMIAELKKNTTFRHMVAASSRLRHGALGLEVAPLEVLWAPRPRYHAILGVPMSAKSDLFENAFLDPTPTQPN